MNWTCEEPGWYTTETAEGAAIGIAYEDQRFTSAGWYVYWTDTEYTEHCDGPHKTLAAAKLRAAGIAELRAGAMA